MSLGALDCLLHSEAHFYKRIRTLVKEDEQQTLRFIGAKKEDATLCSKITKTRMDWGPRELLKLLSGEYCLQGEDTYQINKRKYIPINISIFLSHERLESFKTDLLRYPFSI